MKRKYVFKMFPIEEEIELEFADTLTSEEIDGEVSIELDHWIDDCIDGGLNATWEEIEE